MREFSCNKSNCDCNLRLSWLVSIAPSIALQHVVMYCNILQHTATYCNAR